MKDFVGKTAFVTGGANGIGLALGQAFVEAGMKVMLADIEPAALAAAVEGFRQHKSNVRGIVCDVADPASVEKAATATFEAFGNVHVLCNNAGVAGGSGIDDISIDTWRWVVDVNLMGVVHGIGSFLPRMRAHGEGGHIVNTASMAGLESGLGFSPYAASKFAVVAMSEGLARELGPARIGVTVLCPGFVRTQISSSARNRPQRYGAPPALDPNSRGGLLAAESARLQRAGLDPSDVAERTLRAIRNGELYVFTHPEMRASVKERFAAIETAMDAAADRPPN
jgi:NAD(P)-dependent dehydrogenase (short-subunit alcohol dehydrogenase family)